MFIKHFFRIVLCFKILLLRRDKHSKFDHILFTIPFDFVHYNKYIVHMKAKSIFPDTES